MNGLLDISDLHKAHNMGRDEVILYPVKELKEAGPSYIGVIRFGDGRYFRTAVYRREKGAFILFRQTTLKKGEWAKGKADKKDNPRASTLLEQVPVRETKDTPHYRGAFYFEERIYSVRLWVRTIGTKKVLHLKLTSRPVAEDF